MDQLQFIWSTPKKRRITFRIHSIFILSDPLIVFHNAFTLPKTHRLLETNSGRVTKFPRCEGFTSRTLLPSFLRSERTVSQSPTHQSHMELFRELVLLEYKYALLRTSQSRKAALITYCQDICRTPPATFVRNHHLRFTCAWRNYHVLATS